MKAFPAKYYDGLTAVSRTVTCTPTSHGLNITGDVEREIHWRFTEMSVDSNDTFHHSNSAEAQLVPFHAQDVKELRSRLPKRKRRKEDMRVFLYCAVILGVVAAMVFWIIPALSPLVLPHLPKELDERLGNYAMERLTTGGDQQCTNPEGQAALDKLVSVLTADLDSPYTYRIRVVKSSMVNALAFPGGQMLVFNSLIARAKNQNELFGVIAHEIAHGEKRHGTENLIRGLATTFVVDVLTGGGGTIFYLATQLNDMDYSQKKEREADAFALDLLAAKSIDPRGLANFFAGLEEKHSKKRSQGEEEFKKWMKFVSTHPGNEERIASAQSHYRDGATYRDYLSRKEWLDLKAICTKP